LNILVTGAGGFIGHHLVKRLKKEGNSVVGADCKYPEFEKTQADIFFNVDLRSKNETESIFQSCDLFDEIYSLASNMGGMGFIENYKAVIMRDNALISINTLEAARKYKSRRLFFSSSACVYNTDFQKTTNNSLLSEDMACPAMPEDGYGWEKLYTELMCKHFQEDFGIDTRVARYHNVYGPLGVWFAGREKAPAAICRKVILAEIDGEIEIWGDGNQTRSFMYIEDCLEGTLKIMRGNYSDPINLGSDRLISINDLVDLASSYENKKLKKIHIPGPIGVLGRNCNNDLIKKKFGWAPSFPLEKGLKETYFWIKKQIEKLKNNGKPVVVSSYLPDY